MAFLLNPAGFLSRLADFQIAVKGDSGVQFIGHSFLRAKSGAPCITFPLAAGLHADGQ